MPEQMRPASKKDAPNPAHTYERTDPNREAGQGRMDDTTNKTPQKQSDKLEQTVTNRQDPTRQINAQDTVNQRGGAVAGQPDHSLLDEEPADADQSPQGKTEAKNKRHPRTGGKGGTPDAGEPRRNG